MHNKIKDWLEVPQSKLFFKIIESNLLNTQEELLSVTDNDSRDKIIRNIERIKVYKEILDLEYLFSGELDQLDI